MAVEADAMPHSNGMSCATGLSQARVGAGGGEPMNVLFDVYQQAVIRKAKDDATDARDTADRLESRVGDLEARVNRLGLTCQALWEILSESTGITLQQVVTRMKEIDLRDGRVDGRIGGQPVTCPACGRIANSATGSCVYCGGAIISRHIVR